MMRDCPLWVMVVWACLLLAMTGAMCVPVLADAETQAGIDNFTVNVTYWVSVIIGLGLCCAGGISKNGLVMLFGGAWLLFTSLFGSVSIMGGTTLSFLHVLVMGFGVLFVIWGGFVFMARED